MLYMGIFAWALWEITRCIDAMELSPKKSKKLANQIPAEKTAVSEITSETQHVNRSRQHRQTAHPNLQQKCNRVQHAKTATIHQKPHR